MLNLNFSSKKLSHSGS